MSRLTVVLVKAYSYSGTTWCNLVLGSHPRAFTLGPPWRVWGLRDQGFAGADLVHGEQSAFWNGFDRFWDRDENFLLALGRYADVSHIVLDNPFPDFSDAVLTHPDLDIKEVTYLRDGRAISASYARKNPQFSYVETIQPSGWLHPSFTHKTALPSTPSAPLFHYEEVHADPVAFLERMGDYIGLHYTERELRFWEFDHHITWGNPGTIATVRLAQGLPFGDLESEAFYREQFERLKRDPVHGFADERWRQQLSRQDRFYFNFLLGAANAEHGYERDRFSAAEIDTFGPELEAREATGAFDPLPRGGAAAHLDAVRAAT